VVELVALIPGPLPPIQLHPSLTALRPDDLLSLRFTWSGLTLQAGKPLRDPNARAAFLVVDFEPQHVIEQAYFEFVPRPRSQASASSTTSSGSASKRGGRTSRASSAGRRRRKRR